MPTTFLPLVLGIASFLGYQFTNKRAYTHSFKSPIDDYIKVMPIFVLPYILLFPYLMVTFFLLFSGTYAVAFPISIAVANSIATIFWYLFPNGVHRTKLKGKGLLAKLLNYIYSHDGDTNGFPSGHVFLSGVCSYYLLLAFPQFLCLWVLLWIIISVSALLTKQHYILDLLGGVLFLLLAICIANLFL